MLHGYYFSDQFSDEPWLEEFIVEYVDDTMDACTRKAFEEYLLLNPALAHQIEEMRETRQLMCGLNCGCAAPDGFQARLRNQLACEMMQEFHGNWNEKLHAHAFLSSRYASFGLALVIMVLGGFYSFSTPPLKALSIQQPQAHFRNPAQTATFLASLPLSVTHQKQLSSSPSNQLRFVQAISAQSFAEPNSLQLKAQCCNKKTQSTLIAIAEMK